MAQVLSDGGGDQLRRTITVPQGVALYLGTVVGAGVLLLPGLAARSPDAGGVATYAGQAFSAAASMVTGWFYFIPAATAQALVALTGVYYVAPYLGLGRAGIFAASGLILLVATAVNMRGITVSGRLQLGFSDRHGGGGNLLRVLRLGGHHPPVGRVPGPGPGRAPTPRPSSGKPHRLRIPRGRYRGVWPSCGTGRVDSGSQGQGLR
jgi:hypothetical protein